MSNNELVQQNNSDIIEKLVLDGDLSRMTSPQKFQYYNNFCQSLGLNPLTQPFQIIKFQGKERLYATKDCTEQLRKLHGVSITDISSQNLGGVFVVTAKACDKEGKTDASTGAVPIEGLKGDALANALMKAETKAKRRVTLSICGLGLLDESETDTMKGSETLNIPHEEIPQTNTTAYNRTELTKDGKPLISNAQFMQAIERLKSGELEIYQKAIDAYSFEETQKKTLDTVFETQNISDEDLDNWATQINQCKTVSELRTLKTRHSPLTTDNFKIFTLISKKKTELDNQKVTA